MKWEMHGDKLVVQMENTDEYLSLKRLRRYLGGEWGYGDAIVVHGELTQLTRVHVSLDQLIAAMEVRTLTA